MKKWYHLRNLTDKCAGPQSSLALCVNQDEQATAEGSRSSLLLSSSASPTGKKADIWFVFGRHSLLANQWQVLRKQEEEFVLVSIARIRNPVGSLL
jgi:hypothetical protein